MEKDFIIVGASVKRGERVSDAVEIRLDEKNLSLMRGKDLLIWAEGIVIDPIGIIIDLAGLPSRIDWLVYDLRAAAVLRK